MNEVVLHERRGPALWITLNRPEKRNALNAEVIAGIRAGYELAHADPEVRAIVLTASGDKAFCAGADLAPGKGFAFDFAQPTTAYANLLRVAQDSTLPSVAAVNGVCMAGGMGLLAMTDLAVAADHAIFGLPEVKVGVFPMQVLSLLQDLVPRRILREWCFGGEPFDAHAAKAAGLVNHVVPGTELQAKTEALVARLVDKSPTAIRRGKYAMRAMASMSFDKALAFAEGQIGLLAMTDDAKEGLAAFNEKRKPVFTGR
jgi:enoyl-CoA hydratase/carnithine racemase